MFLLIRDKRQFVNVVVRESQETCLAARFVRAYSKFYVILLCMILMECNISIKRNLIERILRPLYTCFEIPLMYSMKNEVESLSAYFITLCLISTYIYK